MKNLFLTILFIALMSFAAFSQTVEEQLQVSQQRLVKTLDNLDKAETALKSKDGEIEALKKLNKTLEDSQRTPCTIAMTQVKTDLVFWFGQLSDNEAKNKKVNKVIDKTLKRGEKAINAQCGTSSGSIWKTLWEGAKVAVPIAAIVLANE